MYVVDDVTEIDSNKVFDNKDVTDDRNVVDSEITPCSDLNSCSVRKLRFKEYRQKSSSEHGVTNSSKAPSSVPMLMRIELLGFLNIYVDVEDFFCGGLDFDSQAPQSLSHAKN